MSKSLFNETRLLLPLISAFLLTSPYAFGQGAPDIGNLKATASQTCGNGIELQLAMSKSKHIVLSMKNKKTDATDYFISEGPVASTYSFSRYIPVKYDALSQEFLASETHDIDILWGNSVDENEKAQYLLALGNYSYQCGNLKMWLNDKANELYGESTES